MTYFVYLKFTLIPNWIECIKHIFEHDQNDYVKYEKYSKTFDECKKGTIHNCLINSIFPFWYWSFLKFSLVLNIYFKAHGTWDQT